jgi:hypothetical protein
MDIKQLIKSDIIERTHQITNDSRAFFWLRSNYYKDLQMKELKIGGGNLLVALGLFSALNYLCNIYYCLTKPKNNKFRFKKGIYDPVNKDNFVHFIKNQQSGVIFGIEDLDKKELEILWEDWRNNLVHFCTPRYGNTAVAFITKKTKQSKKEYLSIINDNDPKRHPFLGIRSNWVLSIEILTNKLDIIADYIGNKVLDNAEDYHINTLRKWLDSNIGLR